MNKSTSPTAKTEASPEARKACTNRLGSAAQKDMLAIVGIICIVYWVAARIDALEWLWQWSQRHDDWQLDEALVASFFLSICFAVFSFRRWREMKAAFMRQNDAEIALRQKAEALVRSNTELEQFANVVSHDLQEPLRMVASYTQLLQRRYKGKLGQDADDFIHFAVDGALRMQGIIQDMLQYSRVERKGRPFVKTQVAESCKQALDNLQMAVSEKQARVSWDELPKVMADPMQITLLVQNLIGNAIKFTDIRQPEVKMTASLQGNEWLFSVKDNGIGIDPKYAERVFLMFQRLNTRTAYPGTGMGLAICRKIVERHGGRIWVESQPGQGSDFRFTMPRTND